MAKPLISKKRTRTLCFALFLFGLAFLSFNNKWWPGIMLVIGIPLALKQFLLGKRRDALLSLIIFAGFFITAQFDISWQILLPVLFVMAAIYIICREWVEGTTPPVEADADSDLNKEIEEESSIKKP